MNEVVSIIPDTEIREPPFNYEAEQALLGAILVNNDAYGRVGGWLKPEHFADPGHAYIFQACGKLIGEGRIADPITMRELAQDNEHIPDNRYLAQLAASAVTIINAYDYGRIVFECWQRREAIEIAEDLTLDSMDCNAGATEIIEGNISNLQDLLEGPAQTDTGTLGHYADIAIEASQVAYKHDGQFTGIATGLGHLDGILGGLQAGQSIVFAGRPGMGKTTLATNIALNVAEPNGPIDPETGEQQQGKAVGFFSLEMEGEQIAQILLARRTRIPTDRQRAGDLNENDWRRLLAAKAQIAKLPFHIDCTPKMTVEQIRIRAKRLKKAGKLDLLIIDYLQLIRPINPKSNRVEQVTQITQDLKALARELKTPTIALSQLSREVEKRDDKRPQLADLRDSGSIEQDADAVIFLYRHEYYLNQKQPEPGSQEYVAWTDQIEKYHNVLELNVAKNRMGRTERIKASYNVRESRIENLERR